MKKIHLHKSYIKYLRRYMFQLRQNKTLYQQVVGIPMGRNCAPLLADLFLYSYESEFLQNL